ncbi:excinuclease ABC subunit UvrC [Accumulibacter sp.]|uniref:excinuclease ABC subunit UvrC n=1 Tax=Accumulibacter sp. TaxID=2053492 RepID=UPI0025FADCE8|nr:excinuclease ABC subunit UvrC [Accumulibacter sp.]MCM8596159.1 excinuclease ABC subunit UvrC [Accumulibacter sp.]MCM8626209.1 excinuclease ABC subunit UvrC [Accumulibacter sp.]MDS4050308.1 excinuclease ABC subunit UvrC [Accumulibacter sp.]
MNDAFDAESLLAGAAELPGVYRMIDAVGEVLYVGKAKNLRKRLASYFRNNHQSPRIALMVGQVARVDTTVTRSEAEALLLENNLIKSLSPRYNILFRDDKSYPYIVLTHDGYPRLAFFRGSTDRRADYFGPFPSAVAVRESVHLLQKMFRLRTCENPVFNNRSRPCLLYQIRRCSGPCVGLVDRDSYARDVRLAKLFLQGRQQDVLAALSAAMDEAAARLAFEQAAVYRDQIQSLRQVQEKQYVESGQEPDVDIVAAVGEGQTLCVNLAMVRGGRHLGDRPRFPANPADSTALDALGAFLCQHYLAHPVPARILTNLALPDSGLADSLSEIAGRPLRISQARSVAQRVWVEMAEQNARLAIAARRAALARQGTRIEALWQRLGLDREEGSELRIECFDVSHTQGDSTVAACVVYQGSAMRKSEYRRFNIRDIQPGDDYAAIRQVVQRRYEKLATGDGVVPALVLIDGGSGQVSAAASVLEEMGLADLPLLGVAKGEARRPGLEMLVFPDGREPLQLSAEDPALQLIIEIRDEAHRFAVAGHRARRGRAAQHSRLDEIDGIGPKRRKALITRFGGLQGLTDAGLDQLTAVPGISRELAERIYAAFHRCH